MEARKKITLDDLIAAKNLMIGDIIERFDNLTKLKFVQDMPPVLSLYWIVIIRPFLAKSLVMEQPEGNYVKLRYRIYSKGLSRIMYIFYGTIPIGKIDMDYLFKEPSMHIKSVGITDEIYSIIAPDLYINIQPCKQP